MIVLQERAKVAAAGIQQENAARQKREEAELQQLEQRRKSTNQTLLPLPASGDCSSLDSKLIQPLHLDHEVMVPC